MKGFTLLELIMVIAFIGIIAAVTIPEVEKLQSGLTAKQKQLREDQARQQRIKKLGETRRFTGTHQPSPKRITNVAEYNPILIEDEATVLSVVKYVSNLTAVEAVGSTTGKQLKCQFKTQDYTAVGDKVYIYVFRKPLEYQTGL